MAKKTIITVVDDVDGADLGEDFVTVKFSIGSKDYEFDTSAENAAKFYDEMEKYTAISRKLARNGKPYHKKNLDAQNTKLVREWASKNGFSVSDRGRIPADVQDAYDAAH